MQMLHLGYSKFIQINVKDQKLPWILHYINKLGVFVLPVCLLNKTRMTATSHAIS